MNANRRLYEFDMEDFEEEEAIEEELEVPKDGRLLTASL